MIRTLTTSLFLIGFSCSASGQSLSHGGRWNPVVHSKETASHVIQPVVTATTEKFVSVAKELYNENQETFKEVATNVFDEFGKMIKELARKFWAQIGEWILAFENYYFDLFSLE